MVVVLEDLFVGEALAAHDGGAYLAETYSVPPSGTVEDDALGDAVCIEVEHLGCEGRGVEMGGG